jgi:hypothetical protein
MPSLVHLVHNPSRTMFDQLLKEYWRVHYTYIDLTGTQRRIRRLNSGMSNLKMGHLEMQMERFYYTKPKSIKRYLVLMS